MNAATDAAIRLLRDAKYPEAEVAFRQILEQEPDNADALHGSSVLAFQQGDKSRAQDLLVALLKVEPGRVSARYDLACMLIDQAQDVEAVTLLRQVVAETPSHASAWYQLGFALKMQGQGVEAEQALQACLALAPEHAAAANELARIHRDRGDYPAALATFEHAAASEAADPDVFHLWWQFASMSALAARGQAALQQGVTKFPVDSILRIDLANALEGSGDRARAEQQYRVALGLDAGRGQAIGALLSLIGDAAEPGLVTHAERIVSDPAIRLPAKAVVGYGLGKVLQGRKNFQGAFQAWSIANAARRLEVGALDRAALLAQIEEAEHAFVADELQTLSQTGSGDDTLVFIVGMPRSGTTLVEQIIASHPDAEGLGELPDIPIVAENFCRDFGEKAHWPSTARVLSSDGTAISRATAHYRRVVDYRLPTQAARVVDKAPLNFFYLGLIAVLFPKARIIWCRRDPRDVCLSIYTENFADSQKYATDLGDLGFYYRQHERLMRHWQATIPNPICEVSYEQMVVAQEEQTRRLIDFVGLPWNEACLQFHDSNRSVQTPSRWQVRKPMYKTSLERWRHYEPWLQPLFAELDAHAAGTESVA